MNSMRIPMSSLLAALLASVALAACDNPDGTATSSAPSDNAVVAQGDASRSDSGTAAAPREGQGTIGTKVDDAVITTSVNAELAKDENLSALKIDVDTSNGRVVLHGTAPSESARARAGELAAGVDGVVAVDNALTIEQK